MTEGTVVAPSGPSAPGSYAAGEQDPGMVAAAPIDQHIGTASRDLSGIYLSASNPTGAEMNGTRLSGGALSGYLETLKKYLDFNGRSSRREFWTFYLINSAISGVLGMISFVISLASQGRLSTVLAPLSTLSSLISLAIAIPTLAVAVRRLHDTGYSGWWLLVPIANIIFFFTDGTQGSNSYGTDPKAAAEYRFWGTKTIVAMIVVLVATFLLQMTLTLIAFINLTSTGTFPFPGR